MKSLTRPLAFKWHTAVIAWRLATGRWFVYRDRPLWYVVEVACLAEESDEYSEIVNEAIRGAKSEMMARYRRIKNAKTESDVLDAIK